MGGGAKRAGQQHDSTAMPERISRMMTEDLPTKIIVCNSVGLRLSRPDLSCWESRATIGSVARFVGDEKCRRTVPQSGHGLKRVSRNYLLAPQLCAQSHRTNAALQARAAESFCQFDQQRNSLALYRSSQSLPGTP